MSIVVNWNKTQFSYCLVYYIAISNKMTMPLMQNVDKATNVHFGAILNLIADVLCLLIGCFQ